MTAKNNTLEKKLSVKLAHILIWKSLVQCRSCFMNSVMKVYLTSQKFLGSPLGIMAEVLDCGFEVSKYECQLLSYIHLATNRLVKGMNSLLQIWVKLFEVELF